MYKSIEIYTDHIITSNNNIVTTVINWFWFQIYANNNWYQQDRFYIRNYFEMVTFHLFVCLFFAFMCRKSLHHITQHLTERKNSTGLVIIGPPQG